MTHTRRHLFVSLFLLFLLSSTLAGAGPSFELTATEKDFGLYFPAYLANGFFTTSTSLRGTDATLSFMVGVMDYTPGDVPRPAALPSWAEMDYFDGAAWLNATPVSASSLQNYRQTLHMYDGVLSTQYVFVSGSHSTRVAMTTFVSEDATHLGLTSRATYNREKDRYEILHVCSPDEAYNDVPNDSFTNAVAQKALRAAVAAAGVVGQAPDPQWAEIAQKMYIPFSEKEQRHLDFDEAVPNTMKTWMGSSISWLSYPPLDLAMSSEVRRNDFNFAIKSLSELTPGTNDINDMVPVMP